MSNPSFITEYLQLMLEVAKNGDLDKLLLLGKSMHEPLATSTEPAQPLDLIKILELQNALIQQVHTMRSILPTEILDKTLEDNQEMSQFMEKHIIGSRS